MRKIGRAIAAWWPTALTLGAVLWLTLAQDPVPDLKEVPLFPGADKVVHFIMFGGLTGVVILDTVRLRRARLRQDIAEEGDAGAPRTKKERRLLKPAFLIILGVVMVALAWGDELAQDAMGLGRARDVMDFLADTGGIITALIIAEPVCSWLLSKICRHSRLAEKVAER